jgi:hypothetical protein
LQFGKASDCDAITWGAVIGGRTATVPKKQQRTKRLIQSEWLRAMSAMGEKLTYSTANRMSAKCQKADVGLCRISNTGTKLVPRRSHTYVLESPRLERWQMTRAEQATYSTPTRAIFMKDSARAIALLAGDAVTFDSHPTSAWSRGDA